jgi:hypothetical protein
MGNIFDNHVQIFLTTMGKYFCGHVQKFLWPWAKFLRRSANIFDNHGQTFLVLGVNSASTEKDYGKTPRQSKVMSEIKKIPIEHLVKERIPGGYESGGHHM